MNIAWCFGVEFMREVEDGRWIATFDSPEGVAALQYIKDLRWKYNALSGNNLIDQMEMQRMFAQDEGAMYISSPIEQYLTELYNMPIDRLAQVKMPAGSAGRYSLMGGKTHMFSPEASKEELKACLKWLEISGYKPIRTIEDYKEYVKQRSESERKQAERGNIVAAEYETNSVWDVSEFKEKISKEPYSNIDERMIEQAYDFSDVTIRLEEPMYCQELYAILDTCLQTVIADENSDPEQLMKKGAEIFQTQYLDKIM